MSGKFRSVATFLVVLFLASSVTAREPARFKIKNYDFRWVIEESDHARVSLSIVDGEKPVLLTQFLWDPDDSWVPGMFEGWSAPQTFTLKEAKDITALMLSLEKREKEQLPASALIGRKGRMLIYLSPTSTEDEYSIDIVRKGSKRRSLTLQTLASLMTAVNRDLDEKAEFFGQSVKRLVSGRLPGAD